MCLAFAHAGQLASITDKPPRATHSHPKWADVSAAFPAATNHPPTLIHLISLVNGPVTDFWAHTNVAQCKLSNGGQCSTRGAVASPGQALLADIAGS